jgi:aspartate/methionine/tyrosine aminotransferase
MTFTTRVSQLKAEGAYQVLARAQALEKEGRDIIHLEIGEPDFHTAPPISMAGVKAIVEGRTRYNPPSGITDLRALIAQDAGPQRGMTINAAQVVISPGAKPNLFFPTLALVEPGDEVIYPDPGFPTYEAMIQIAGGGRSRAAGRGQRFFVRPGHLRPRSTTALKQLSPIRPEPDREGCRWLIPSTSPPPLNVTTAGFCQMKSTGGSCLTAWTRPVSRRCRAWRNGR